LGIQREIGARHVEKVLNPLARDTHLQQEDNIGDRERSRHRGRFLTTRNTSEEKYRHGHAGKLPLLHTSLRSKFLS
jgi:hypothetical protein